MAVPGRPKPPAAPGRDSGPPSGRPVPQPQSRRRRQPISGPWDGRQLIDDPLADDQVLCVEQQHPELLLGQAGHLRPQQPAHVVGAVDGGRVLRALRLGLDPTHELKETKGRTLTQRYAALLEHYGLQATRTNPRSSHENGVAEQAHYRLKTALAQALIIRGSRDFPSVAGYSAFVQGVVDKSNRRVQGKLDVERPYLRSLPQAAVPEYTTWRTKVKKWSTIRVTNKTYSVPSRLCGHEVKVHQYADYLEVYYKDHMVERLERVRGEHKSRIDYRHIIWSLVRKPGAFARYRFREHLFPTPVFRQAYDALGRWHGGRTDVEYVRILHLAASTLEARVERALSQLLLTGRSFDYAAVQELAAPTPPQIPQLPSLSAPDLKVYDALLQGVG